MLFSKWEGMLNGGRYMGTKRHFLSIRWKLIGLILLGMIAMLMVVSAVNYFFFKDLMPGGSFLSYVTKIGPIIIVTLVAIIMLILYFLNKDLIKPIDSLTNVTSNFAYDTNDKRKENVEKIFKLKYHKRKDELGKLYSAIAMASRESMEFADDIMKQAETITKMQNGLLMVIAEIVESRDHTTGTHIKKTKAYVELIANEMKKRGMYKDILTDKFIYNTINAAPLHDVGKIHIPDSILMGTQKLTDEEYEIMKTHTTYGAKMIQYAIDKMGDEDAGYLEEAKNVANYHHEKWNGQGYPMGLKGEEIPLSARIMAVADVFDAIHSCRSYKASVPFEETVKIIKESAGSHFDPLVVEAFIGVEDEVKKIAEEFDENEIL